MLEGEEYLSKISSYNELNVYMKCGDSRQEERGHISFILLTKQHGISKQLCKILYLNSCSNAQITD